MLLLLQVHILTSLYFLRCSYHLTPPILSLQVQRTMCDSRTQILRFPPHHPTYLVSGQNGSFLVSYAESPLLPQPLGSVYTKARKFLLRMPPPKSAVSYPSIFAYALGHDRPNVQTLLERMQSKAHRLITKKTQSFRESTMDRT